MKTPDESKKLVHDILGKISVISLNVEILESDSLSDAHKIAALNRIKIALDEAVTLLQFDEPS